MGVYKGLLMAWECGIRQLLVETDSSCHVALILGKEAIAGTHASLIRSIRGLLAQAWQVKVYHVYREGNFVADKMTVMANKLPLGFHSSRNLPMVFYNGCFTNRYGVVYPRMRQDDKAFKKKK
ncbi:nucleic acid binding protein, putative [Ricinus communis]|uniref:Nucleic acid binding protein, putative n=1 Tax=Ricinus communis TaxID=3988 RepID=B9SFS3_RICCO|nr:nucleic acid binding protein, putative [Ricinus communis]